MSIERQIFTRLLNNNSLNISDSQDYKLVDIIQFIIKYEELGVVEYKDGIIFLKDEAVKYLMAHRKAIFLKKVDKIWEKIPDHLLQDTIEIDKPIRIYLKGDWHTSH